MKLLSFSCFLLLMKLNSDASKSFVYFIQISFYLLHQDVHIILYPFQLLFAFFSTIHAYSIIHRQLAHFFAFSTIFFYLFRIQVPFSSFFNTFSSFSRRLSLIFSTFCLYLFFFCFYLQKQYFIPQKNNRKYLLSLSEAKKHL